MFYLVNYDVLSVNLGAPPTLSCGAVAVDNSGGGMVKIERKGDSLYLDDKKIIPFRHNGQKDYEKMDGYELAKALEGRPVLHPNILDALCHYPHLIPNELKYNERGETILLHFWGVKFRTTCDDLLCVRYGSWDHQLYEPSEMTIRKYRRFKDINWCKGRYRADIHGIGHGLGRRELAALQVE